MWKRKKNRCKIGATLCLRDLGHVRWIALWGRTLGGGRVEWARRRNSRLEPRHFNVSEVQNVRDKTRDLAQSQHKES